MSDATQAAAPAQPELMTRAEVAAYLRTTPNALSVSHSKRKPHVPPFKRYGRRVLYRRVDVEACLKAEHT